MIGKKINQLPTELAPVTTDLTIIGDPVTGVSKKITLSQIANLFATSGTVTSVAVTETGDALTITGSPITTSGTINIAFAGTSSQYVNGAGNLTTFPTSLISGSGASGQVTYFNGTNSVTGNNNFFWDTANNRLGVGLVNPQRSIEIYNATADNHLRLSGNAPSVSMGEAVTGSVYQAKFGLVTVNGQFAAAGLAGDFVIISQTGATIFVTNSTEKMRVQASGNMCVGNTNDTYKLDVTGTGRFTGQLRLESTITNGTYTYTLPSATGTLALTSDIPSLTGYVPYTGATGNVDLGSFDLTTDIINLNQLKAVGSGGLNIYSNNGTHIAAMGGGGGANLTFYGGLNGTSASFSSSLTASSLVKSGGTSSQFLKADGSVDSTAYGTGSVTSVGLSSATSGVTIGSTPITTSGTITLAIATASGSQQGLLSSTDWTTFNGKQAALNGTGFVKISGTTISYDNSTYLTTSAASSTYLPLAGGTLTGALGGTSATFSSSLTASGGRVTIQGTNQNAVWFNQNAGGSSTGYLVGRSYSSDDANDFFIYNVATATRNLAIASTGAATFSSSVTATSFNGTTNNIFSVSGTEGMRLTSTGLGIGTTSPSTLFYVNGYTAANWITTLNNTGTSGHQMYFGYNDGSTTRYGLYIAGGQGSGASNFDLAVANKFYVMSNGNVGIGTTTPGSKLSIVGLPTSSAGLTSGDIYVAAGVLMIV